VRVYASIEEYLQWQVRIRPLASFELLRACAAEALEGSEETGYTLRVDPAIYSFANAPSKNPGLQWEALERVECPTLVLRGTNSAVLPRAVATRMAAAIPDCALLEIERSGHAIMLDNPAAFREHVRRFLVDVGNRV